MVPSGFAKFVAMLAQSFDERSLLYWLCVNAGVAVVVFVDDTNVVSFPTTMVPEGAPSLAWLIFHGLPH